MSDFICFEAADENTDTDQGMTSESERAEERDSELIDNTDYNESVSDYYSFENVTRLYEETMEDALEDFDHDQDLENYCEEPTNAPIDDFNNSKIRVDKFKSSLVNPQGVDNPDSLFYGLVYALRYWLTNKIEPCADDTELRTDVKTETFDEFNLIKERLKLDLDLMNFENQCFQINRILMKSSFFLRVYELKDKFQYLLKQDPQKKNVIRDLSSCIIEKFNGFNIARLELDRELRKEISPIDFLYKPVKKDTNNVECFFSTQINLAYRNTFSEDKKVRHGTAFQCFFCSKYFGRKNMWERHFQNCTDRPGFVCNINTRTLLTFEENLKCKCDVPMTAYIDFETTAPTDDCLDPESRKMFAVSYVIIFAFHPDLGWSIERSFGHTQAQPCSLNYLTNKQLKFKNLTNLKQLRDCALSVSSKKKKNAISEMITTELKFAGDCLMRWFNTKFKIQNVAISNDVKRRYEIEHPINKETGRCCICSFPTEINPTMSYATEDQMSYSDFVICKEHKFLRNIFSKEELATTSALKDLSTYHEKFTKFIHISIYLQNSIDTIQEFSDCPHEELLNFCLEFCSDCVDFIEIKERISDMDMKNNPRPKISKRTLQLYAYFYQKIMDFLRGKFDYETLTIYELFVYVHRIISAKIHLHHSHVTGKILGYAQDFCNEKVRG